MFDITPILGQPFGVFATAKNSTSPAMEKLIKLVKDGYNMYMVDWNDNSAVISIGGSERKIDLKRGNVGDQIDEYRKKLGGTGLTPSDKSQINSLRF